MEINDLKKVLAILLVVVAVVTLSFSVFSKAEKEHGERQLSVISYQLSVISYQQSAVSSHRGIILTLQRQQLKLFRRWCISNVLIRRKVIIMTSFTGIILFLNTSLVNRKSQEEEEVQQFGSGVIISSDGYIVTNNHVVQDADSIQVTLNDKRVYIAKLIGNDPNSDIAVVKIDANNLPFLTYGNSDEVKVGEWVLAVGNPYNLTSTVTAGIVSAKARNINILGGRKYYKVIYTNRCSCQSG